MHDKAFRVLLRIAIELSSRTCLIRRYLDQIGPGETGEHKQLVGTIRAALDGIEQLLPTTLDGVSRFLGSGEPGREVGLEVLASYLAKFSRWFQTVHALLVFLPRQPVTIETVSALEDAFGPSYAAHHPSIILGSLFNALEFDFFQVVREKLPDLNEVVVGDSRNIVLQLPICDRESPHAWPILAHEMGHAIDLHEGISREVAEQFVTDPQSPAYGIVRSWCQELSADLIAAKVLGPSPILALISLEYCLHLHPLVSIYFPSSTHPSTRWRLRVVSEFLERLYGGADFLEEERDFYDLAAEYSLHRAITDPKDRMSAVELDTRQFENIVLPLVEALEKRVLRLFESSPSLNEASLGRCDLRLRQGLPVSAQGATRENLQGELKRYRQRRFKSNEDKISAFRDMLPLFKEDPLDMPTIFMSGFRRRREMIEQIIGRVLEVESANSSIHVKDIHAISELCDGFNRLDLFIMSSINTSCVHKRLSRDG